MSQEEKKYTHILVIEDDEDDYFILSETLKEIPFAKKTEWAINYEKAKEFLAKEEYEVCLVDYRLGAQTGIDIISKMSVTHPNIPCILLTGLKENKIDEEALKSGAYDYIVKGQYNADTLGRSIRYSISRAASTKELKLSENKFKGLFDNAPTYIFIVDDNKIIQETNSYFLHRFNLELKDVKGKHIFSFFDTEVNTCPADKKDKTMSEVYRGINKKEHQYIFNGEKVICEIVVSPLTDGKNTLFQVMLNDVTEIRNKKDKEKILEKQALTGRFARVIAHEIKNPLTSIKLSLGEIKEITGKLTPAEEASDAMRFLKILEKSSDRINNLLNDLLDATRLDILKIEEHDLDDIIEESYQQVIDRANLKSVKLEKQELPGHRIKADRDKLVIAFTNLFVNAVEAVTEKTGAVRVSISRNDKNYVIKVADNGCGIPAENLPKLFEPFFTSKREGTGLGLTATYNIINKHDGNIEVNSKTDEGTAFTITLPANA